MDDGSGEQWNKARKADNQSGVTTDYATQYRNEKFMVNQIPFSAPHLQVSLHAFILPQDRIQCSRGDGGLHRTK